MPEKFIDLFTESGVLGGDMMPTEHTDEFLVRIGLDPMETIPHILRCYGHEGQFVLAGIQIGYYIAQVHFARAKELDKALGDIDLEP
jgi:hypothetical protein